MLQGECTQPLLCNNRDCRDVILVYYVIMLALLIGDRKKVHTDPRLSKSKSPSSSGHRWYTGGDDEVEITPSVLYSGGHLYHATTNELSPPLLGLDDASSVSILDFSWYTGAAA